VASERARFGQPEISLGIVTGWGGSQRLTRLVPPGYAKEMILTGAPIDAAEALRVGLGQPRVSRRRAARPGGCAGGRHRGQAGLGGGLFFEKRPPTFA